VIDTGSRLTIIPEKVWGDLRFPGTAVERLPVPPELIGHPLRVRGIDCQFDLCRVRMSAIGSDLRVELPTVSVLAQFAQDGSRLSRYVVVGLFASILTGRRLVIGPGADEAFLESLDSAG
jgi:hypothetical protein